MILWIKKRAVTLCICCMAGLPVFGQQDLLNYENSLKFARYLSNTQQYTFAAQEYERLHFLWPDDNTVIYELVRTYRLNQDCSQFANAVQLLSSGGGLQNNPDFSRAYLRYCLTCSIEHPSYFDVASLLKEEEEAFYSLGYFWVTQQYDSAFSYNNRNAEMISRINAPLHLLTRDFENEKYKKPWLALTMSAVVPGSGKAYAKRWGDAAISLLFVSTSAFASFRAFSKKGVKSVNGWIFGGVAISFYTSNIYGSFKAARRYNKDMRVQYQENAKHTIYTSF